MTQRGQGEFRNLLRKKLSSRGVATPETADVRQWYLATILTVREWVGGGKTTEEGLARRVAYLCMEFLLGRLLVSNLEALGLREEVEEELSLYGHTLAELEEEERDPGLGNGGLGRLAACFLDSLSALSYPAIGYSLCYGSGLFRQKIVDGAQVELPDDWIPEGGAWLIPRPERSVTVRFGGRIEERWEDGRLHILHTEYDEVRAVPYDIPIIGAGGGTVNTLRLFRARDVGQLPDGSEGQSGYVTAMRALSAREELTARLYPPDHHEEGKLLRLCRQYFLVSAALQDMIATLFLSGGRLPMLPSVYAIHLNDTHPALAVPELMRILLDTYSYTWEDAFSMVRALFTYTNHTVLPEALECWRTDLFRLKLPRIFSIIEEMNRRMTEALFRAHEGDWERISRMALIAYGQVRMANLSLYASHTVNGVSRLHGEILQKSIFRDFYADEPEKFCSITNGVTHRRWLLYANRSLASMLDGVIGRAYREDCEALAGLMAYADDARVLEELLAVKRKNKERFSRFLVERSLRPLDLDAILDVQIKRIHEYKRQLLNLLKILSLWQEVRGGELTLSRPITFVFGGKAAPDYYMAKELIRLAVALGEELAADTAVRELLRVEFLEEYNVSMAEILIPAAEISEQISLAGKEASGTGCMKLMMNGALTIGTLDGANVEIAEAVGEENFYLFGLREHEVEERWREGYDARSVYRASHRLRWAVDRLYHPIAGRDFSHIADYLIAGAPISDPYMCLADFESYRTVYGNAVDEYEDRLAWGRRSLINIACSGRFSSDRSIREYAEKIWHLPGGGV